MRYWLAPLSLIYRFGVWFRYQLYELRLLRRARFDLPIICVGNLAAGGTGKTPHVEYLTRFLGEYLQVGILSRGYGRKTTGFRWVERTDTVATVGDEPLLLKHRFPEIPVAVCADRVFAVPKMVEGYPELQAIIMDDGFQHLPLQAGFYILLTAYSRLYPEDAMLPVGMLREPIKGAARAQVVIVTKCPPSLSQAERERIISSLQLLPEQRVFFTTYEYGLPYHHLFPQHVQPLTPTTDVVLLTGIADNGSLLDYLRANTHGIHAFEHPDHHTFSNRDIGETIVHYEDWKSERKMILTTEKDLMRLASFRSSFARQNIPLFVLPIRVRFLFEEEGTFQALLQTYMLEFMV